MELGKQIKFYRNQFGLSQDDLAETIYVSRQTISSWENDKSYPDIHSLVLLSNLFRVSVDELIKGDIEMMKETINENDLKEFNHLSNVFLVLFIIMIISAPVLWHFMRLKGAFIFIPFYAYTMYIGLKLEKIKKSNNIQTYKEIEAFMNGKTLDMIDKEREDAKRPYQNVMKYIAGAGIAIIAFMIYEMIIRLF